MIGIAIASKREWTATLEYLNLNKNKINIYPYGEYIVTDLYGKEVLLYFSNNRKVMSSGAAQYMISNFNLNKIIIIGTCAGINDNYKELDILIPTQAVQYDCTVREIEPLLKEKFIVDLYSSDNNKQIIIGTTDKAVVMWDDFKNLQNNKIDIADMESGSVAYICKLNNIKCVIIKGISDFPLSKENQEVNKEQWETYRKNVPTIIKIIINNYLQNEIEK